MAMLFDDIIPVLVFGLAGLIFIGIMMFLSWISRPKGNKTPLKLMSYECGEEPVSDRLGFQFNYQYFIYAIVFTALDVIAMFVYAWAVSGRVTDIYQGVIPVAIFIGIIMLAFVFVVFKTKDWKKDVM